MKAESFIKMLRTIINEEVRKVVREELDRTLNEGAVTSPTIKESKVNFRDKYKDVFGADSFSSLHAPSNDIVPTNKAGKPALVNLSSNGLVNSILAETAQQMRQDPSSGAFFEGLR